MVSRNVIGQPSYSAKDCQVNDVVGDKKVWQISNFVSSNRNLDGVSRLAKNDQ